MSAVVLLLVAVLSASEELSVQVDRRQQTMVVGFPAGAGILIASGLTLTPGGAPYVFDSSDNAALSYVVQPGDAADYVYADIATTFYVQGGGALC